MEQDNLIMDQSENEFHESLINSPLYCLVHIEKFDKDIIELYVPFEK